MLDLPQFFFPKTDVSEPTTLYVASNRQVTHRLARFREDLQSSVRHCVA